MADEAQTTEQQVPAKKPRKKQDRTSKRQIDAASKRAQALQLRLAGVKLEMIAEIVGYASKSGAHGAITEALKEMIAEPAEELRTIQNLRLEEMFFVLYPFARKGHLDYMDRLLKIFERQAKLNGLDMPTKVAPTDPTGTKSYEPNPANQPTDDQRDARIVALYEHVRARVVRELADGGGDVVPATGTAVRRLPLPSG